MPPAPILACTVHALIRPLRLLVFIVLLLNKLHMDPQSADSLLQKTSPASDPAPIMQLSTELFAQANQLAIHQQQLNRLTSLTEELVTTLKNLSIAAQQPASAQMAAPVNAMPSQNPAVSPRLAFPDKFDGDSSKCQGLLLQCSLFVNQQPMLYPTDLGKIYFVCSLLTGKALEWATAVWRADGSTFPSFEAFLHRFKEVFGHPAGDKSAGKQLMLNPGRKTAAEYTLSFHTLAAKTDWTEDALFCLNYCSEKD